LDQNHSEYGCRRHAQSDHGITGGQTLRSGLTPSDTLALLLGWNDRTCRPPLPQREVEAIIISIAKREGLRRQREEPAQ
jgi:hypothetical protein